MAMRFLTDRKQIANEINIKRTPVLKIDISKCMRGYDDCYEGGKIEIQHPIANDLYCRCTVKMFGDEKGNVNNHRTPWLYEKIGLYEGMVGIHSDFGASDVREMAEWNNVRRAKQGDEVIVMFDNGEAVFLRKMRIGRVTANVYPLAVLEDVE